MSFLLKINHSNHLDNFDTLFQHESDRIILLSGCDGSETTHIGRTILGCLSAFMNNAMEGIPISELDRIIMPDFGSEIITLAIQFVYNGHVNCTSEQYYDVIEVMQLLGLCQTNDFKLTDVFGNDVVVFEEDMDSSSQELQYTKDELLDDDDNKSIAFDEVSCFDNDDITICLPLPVSTTPDGSIDSPDLNISGACKVKKVKTAQSVTHNMNYNPLRSTKIKTEEQISNFEYPESGTDENLGKNLDILFSCSVCDKSFSTASFLEAHQRKHTRKTRKFCCSLCSFKSEKHWDLQTHQKEMHLDQFVFNCVICDRKFSSIRNLDKHSTVVHGPKRFKCDICSLSFNQGCHLRRHVASVHLKERPHCCIKCGRCFTRDTSLAAHQCKL